MIRRHSPRSALWLLILGVALASLPMAVAGSAPAVRSTRLAVTTTGGPGFLRVGGLGANGLRQIVDQQGRSVLLRGVNVAGLVDYWQPSLHTAYPVRPASYADGRCPRDNTHVSAVPICRDDFAQLQPLGYDVIRLNVSWSLLEPRPGRINWTYVHRIAQVVGWAKSAGIWVVIDLHQDAWSKFLFTAKTEHCPRFFHATRGFDGAPRWATPRVLHACSAMHTRNLDLAMQTDAQRFWANAHAPDGIGLQQHYARVVSVLARQFANDPAVAGYDLMNEPTPGLAPQADDQSELMPFYARVVRTVRADVPHFRQLFFIEPDVERDNNAQRAFVTVWRRYSSYSNVVYAPHVYTDVFTGLYVGGRRRHEPSFQQDYGTAVADAKALGLPLWVGEFGCSPAQDSTVLADHYAEQQFLGIGGALWIWKQNGRASNSWAVYDPPYRGAATTGTPRRERLQTTSRVYPVRTQGELLQSFSDSQSRKATVAAMSSTRTPPGDFAHATLVDVPAFYRGRIRVQGARSEIVTVDGARLVWLFPSGHGRYGLTVHP